MIDESCGLEEEEARKRLGVRTSVMISLSLNALGFLPRNPVRRASDLGYILRLVMAGYVSTRKRTVMDVERLTTAWIDAIVGMCAAHDKDKYDAHDAKADELLSPILAAPVKQVREFYHRLGEKMKTDQRVPFLVWVSFEAWGEVVVKNAPDEGIKRLKRKLAADIAELVEKPVAEQLPEAIKRALMWRDEETLKGVKETLEGGAKPRLVGRQSCLFLECGRGKKKVSVMI
jgi:hypothetical protein